MVVALITAARIATQTCCFDNAKHISPKGLRHTRCIAKTPAQLAAIVRRTPLFSVIAANTTPNNFPQKKIFRGTISVRKSSEWTLALKHHQYSKRI
jgi:hypothetical protein